MFTANSQRWQVSALRLSKSDIEGAVLNAEAKYSCRRREEGKLTGSLEKFNRIEQINRKISVICFSQGSFTVSYKMKILVSVLMPCRQ